MDFCRFHSILEKNLKLVVFKRAHRDFYIKQNQQKVVFLLVLFVIGFVIIDFKRPIKLFCQNQPHQLMGECEFRKAEL